MRSRIAGFEKNVKSLPIPTEILSVLEPPYHLMVLLAATTGLRRSELFANSSLLFGLGFIGMIRRFLFFALFNQQPVGRNLDIPNAAELQLALQINRDDFMIED